MTLSKKENNVAFLREKRDQIYDHLFYLFEQPLHNQIFLQFLSLSMLSMDNLGHGICVVSPHFHVKVQEVLRTLLTIGLGPFLCTPSLTLLQNEDTVLDNHPGNFTFMVQDLYIEDKINRRVLSRLLGPKRSSVPYKHRSFKIVPTHQSTLLVCTPEPLAQSLEPYFLSLELPETISLNQKLRRLKKTCTQHPNKIFTFLATAAHNFLQQDTYAYSKLE